MDANKLAEFLAKAKKGTYASGQRSQKRGDGADVYKFASADFEGFEYEDVYFGGRKFSGQEMVRYNGVVVWSMVYYGGVLKEVLTEDTLYNRFLKKFLSNLDNIPARGADQQMEKNGDDKIIYCNPHTDTKDIKHFRGKESITHNCDTIYELFYSGGMIEE